MMVHDRYCFQAGEGILLNVCPAEMFKELNQGDIQRRSINLAQMALYFFVFF